MKTAAEWKLFYAEERAALGSKGLGAQLERALEIALPDRGALLFPHTRMTVSGHLTAAVARAVVRSGASDVLALGVLHGGRAADAEKVERARAGDTASHAELRRIYADGDAFTREEFSLDNFIVLLGLAAAGAGAKPPRVHARYPFLVGVDPSDVPGVEELDGLAARMPVVATTDPQHHGAGYGTPPDQRRDDRDAATRAWSRERIQAQLDLLSQRDWPSFQRLAAEVHSDFRDTGPMVAHLLRGKGLKGSVVALDLVDYAATLGAPRPTWVAAPLLRLATPSGEQGSLSR